jgi:hypothetical protein
MVRWRRNKQTKNRFIVPTANPESELHPFVARPSAFEPILTTGQKLTPAQKKHLDEEAQLPLEEFYNHLVSVHGDNLPPLHYHSGLDPQVAERFNIPTENILVTREIS